MAERKTAALPPGARLLHIGQPKTATTTLQAAAASRREELLAHGVIYPGTGLNHGIETSALMERQSPAWSRVPDRSRWDALRAEVEAAPAHRAFVSYELIVQADDAAARRFADELGENTYVVITVRAFAPMLPSVWQQYVKSGRAISLRGWLGREFLGDGVRHAAREGAGFWAEHDLAAQVRRWSGVVGPDRVIVVIADKHDPARVTDAFEDLLDLPRGLLRLPQPTGAAVNRSLSPLETRLVLDINRLLPSRVLPRSSYYALIRDGVVATIQQRRSPGPDEGEAGVGRRVAEHVARAAATFVAALRDSGVRVVGDDASLLESAPWPREPGSNGALELDIAVCALRGAASAALGRGVDFESGGGSEPRPVPPPARIRLPRARDTLHVELSGRRPGDRIRPIAAPGDADAIAGEADVLGARRGSRWIRIDAAALLDSDVRSELFAALRVPRVLVTVDDRPERALWEQALARGEWRSFSEWAGAERPDVAAFLEEIAPFAASLDVVDDVALERAAARHPARLAVTTQPAGALSEHDIELIRAFNASTADIPLTAAERVAVVGRGALRGMRSEPVAAPGAFDSAARAVFGIALGFAGHDVPGE
ncbi:hypothetical protein E4U02_14865 [Microbacterium paludicola]|uniref:Sulfotransferase family protein n=1 Tax=Microbacterium paludicola TaxID=300019 RepID=A0A4Y9FP17_9MICO|nr:hypothetical protein [Microbacterium paludicola]MBF0817686.1 hypothetical protein [Microbacterium paludicola]TFU30273.1 hypothetical protein E4U02_14865 [Microbacterium paludicola]